MINRGRKIKNGVTNINRKGTRIMTDERKVRVPDTNMKNMKNLKDLKDRGIGRKNLNTKIVPGVEKNLPSTKVVEGK